MNRDAEIGQPPNALKLVFHIKLSFLLQLELLFLRWVPQFPGSFGPLSACYTQMFWGRERGLEFAEWEFGIGIEGGGTERK